MLRRAAGHLRSLGEIDLENVFGAAITKELATCE
jgi:hypothetical protein